MKNNDNEHKPKSSAIWYRNWIHVKNNWTQTASDYPWCYKKGGVYIIENVSLDSKNSILRFGLYGILIEDSKNDNFIIRNCKVYNSDFFDFFGQRGIVILNSKNGRLMKNNISNYYHDCGILITVSENISVTESTFNYSSVKVYNSKNTTISANNFVYRSISISSSEIGSYNITLSNNNFTYGGIYVSGSIEECVSHNIDSTNKVIGKPIYYYANKSGLDSTNITNAGQILLHYCNNSEIINQLLTNTSTPISLKYCWNNTISYNNISSNRGGVYLSYSENNTVSFNNITNNGGGISLYESNNDNKILNNNVSDCYNGISLQRSENNRISNNIIIKTLGFGIQLLNNDNNKMISNNITDCNGGIYILNSKNTIALENSMINCGIEMYSWLPENLVNTIDTSNTVNGKPVYYYEDQIGLNSGNFLDAGQVILAKCSFSTISNLNFTHGSVSISILHSNNIVVSNNNCSINTQYGISLIYSEYCDIIDNTINQNQVYGLNIEGGCNNNLIKHNFIENNSFDGIYLMGFGTDYNTIINNSISKNGQDGIYFVDGKWNNITQNFIANNSNFGIIMMWADNNLIFNNSFIGNRIHAVDDGVGNEWNNNDIGNYWDNYTGSDPDDDGIGNTPYDIPGEGNRQDLYPICWDGDDTPPIVLINNPSAGIYGPASLLINASITDATQAVAMINASTPFNISMTSSGSYCFCNWDNISLYTSGDYNITIWAIDNNGNINATEYVVITIDIGGAPGLPAGDDDDDGDGKDEFDIVEFLTSPIGLTIIGSSIVAVVVFAIIKIKGTGKSRLKEIERIEKLKSE